MSKRRARSTTPSGTSSADQTRQPGAKRSKATSSPDDSVPADRPVPVSRSSSIDTEQSAVTEPTTTEPKTPEPTSTATSLADSDRSDPAVANADLGAITIDDRVVEKIAARAAIEVPDAGAAAPRVLGRSLAGLAGHAPAGVRKTSLDALPKTTADVDGSVATLDLQISVRWPSSIPEVTASVRRRVGDRVHELTGLTVTDVRIQVTDLVTHLAPPPRVH